MNSVSTSIVRGLPPVSSSHHFSSHGMHTKGKQAALAVVRNGVGHHSVTQMGPCRNELQSFTSGARTVSKRKGGCLKIMQRKNADGYTVYIAFRSDVEG